MQHLQAFKYELMPTGEQQRQMRRFAGACRTETPWPVVPPYGTLQDDGAQLAGQRMADPKQVTGIDQMTFQCLDHPPAIESLTERQSTAVTGGS
ncbi:MAG: helix-turn-helix domain-containing protein [Halomonas sp. BM-2019]|nr:MAG: helix-turn-helix domain-containing protein [Halomonas sp. BM-2019]